MFLTQIVTPKSHTDNPKSGRLSLSWNFKTLTGSDLRGVQRQRGNWVHSSAVHETSAQQVPVKKCTRVTAGSAHGHSDSSICKVFSRAETSRLQFLRISMCNAAQHCTTLRRRSSVNTVFVPTRLRRAFSFNIFCSSLNTHRICLSCSLRQFC